MPPCMFLNTTLNWRLLLLPNRPSSPESKRSPSPLASCTQLNLKVASVSGRCEFEQVGRKRCSQHPRVADPIELGDVARSPEPCDGSTARVVESVAPDHDIPCVRAVELERASKRIGRLQHEIVRKEVVAARGAHNARPLGVANLHVLHGRCGVEPDPGPTTNPNTRHRDLISS
eukprot:5576110-Prymnesium_polylepis.1